MGGAQISWRGLHHSVCFRDHTTNVNSILMMKEELQKVTNAVLEKDI